MARRIVVIPGDGVGPQVIEAAVKVLDNTGFDAEYIWISNLGFSRHQKTGKSISEEEMQILRQADAILKGPLETPKISPQGYRSLTLLIRRDLDLYANVRPFRRGRIDTIIVRENTEDLYVGRERLTESGAVAEREITRKASKRIHSFAFQLAQRYNRKRVTCVHKSNVLPLTDGLFLNIFLELAKQHPEFMADEVIIDTCAYNIQRNPSTYDIMVTTNLYGDILSDQLAGAVGSLGLCASMNIGESHALFEPIHGTALDIAGKNIANPIGAVTAASMMLKHLGENELAGLIDRAIEKALSQDRISTPDLGGSSTTTELTNQIISNLSQD